MLWRRRSMASSRRMSMKSRSEPHQQPVPNKLVEQLEQQELSGSIADVDTILSVLGQNDDLTVRRFEVFGRTPAAILYFSALTDQKMVNDQIIRAFMSPPAELDASRIDPARLQDVLMNATVYFGDTELEPKLGKLVDVLVQGRSIVIVDGLRQAFVFGSKQVEKRSIEQPSTEQTIQGPREGFVELINTNLGLLRYRLPTADFIVKMMQIGRITKSRVAVCYLQGIVNPALVEEVHNRLSAIDIDGIMDSGYLEQLIEDNHISPFPQIQTTEKPDRAVANLLEGRVVILVDGSPFALIAPSVFVQFYQASEDYSSRFLQGSFSRLARVLALVFSLITPSLYVSIISFNPELIPTEFAVAVAGGRAGVPFPSVVEVLIMEIAMEVLREATIRLPQQVGGALSIVGVLVIGQAAVEAGFVSPITVVVIALTTIGSFATPAYNAAFALRMLRFPLILLAGAFGLYGVVIGLIIIGNHALSLKSFGVPYLSPAVPGNWQGMKDLLIRAPLWLQRDRPSILHSPNTKRVGDSTVEAIKQAPSNTLDPLTVGNQRWNPNGEQQTDHDDPGGGHSR